MVKHINGSQLFNKDYSAEESLEMLRVLADETRQQILLLVAKYKEINVTDIANNFSLSRPTISHHLNLMKRVKLLNTRKEGKEIFYSFNKAYVIGLMESFVNNLKNCC